MNATFKRRKPVEKTCLTELFQAINRGLIGKRAGFLIDGNPNCPVLIIGTGNAVLDDQEVVNSIVHGADEYSRRWRIREFFVIADGGGQYNGLVQKTVREKRPSFSWNFPADAPMHWNGIEGGAVWIAEWLCANGFARRLR